MVSCTVVWADGDGDGVGGAYEGDGDRARPEGGHVREGEEDNAVGERCVDDEHPLGAVAGEEDGAERTGHRSGAVGRAEDADGSRPALEQTLREHGQDLAVERDDGDADIEEEEAGQDGVADDEEETLPDAAHGRALGGLLDLAASADEEGQDGGGNGRARRHEEGGREAEACGDASEEEGARGWSRRSWWRSRL